MTLPLQNRNDTAIKVWLPEHIENDLRELAERDGLAVSVLVRMLIKRHLARVRESETLADCADI